jgi:Carboxypeptidase regulatory-like domain
MRLVIVGSCCLLLVGVSAAQISPSPKQSLCTVSGQVVQEPGGTPLRKVLVSVAPASGVTESFARNRRDPYSAVTDAEGHFRIEGVQPGDYRVSLERNGFVATNHRSRVYSSTLVTLNPGQETTGLLFRMQPAGVIQGKIVDEEGDAVPGVEVVAMSPTSQNAFGGGQTNDLGEYRISGLTGGEYLAMAQAAQGPVTANLRPDEPRVYAPTYYPGTADRRQATRIEVHPGDEASANFNLVSSRIFIVRGSVSGLIPRRQPRTSELTNATVTLLPAETQMGQQFQAPILPDGTFQISGVLPGAYRARVTAQTAGVWQTIRTSQIVEVRGADVDGLQLAPEPASEVAGRFRTDNDQKPDWSQVNIQIDPDERDESDGPVVVKVAKDGSFKVGNVPAGNYHVVVTSNSNLEAWRDFIVKEVILNGKDVGDSGFSIAGGLVSLEIIASAGGSTIEGNVLDEDGKPVPDVPVVCIPDANRRKRHDIYQQVPTDQQGHFALRGLNPGEYQVFTLADASEDITDAEFVKAHEALGQTVKLDPGETQEHGPETVGRRQLALPSIHPLAANSHTGTRLVYNKGFE